MVDEEEAGQGLPRIFVNVQPVTHNIGNRTAWHRVKAAVKSGLSHILIKKGLVEERGLIEELQNTPPFLLDGELRRYLILAE